MRVWIAVVLAIACAGCSLSGGPTQGIDVPSDPVLFARSGVALRCAPPKTECFDAASDMMGDLLGSLGEPYAGADPVTVDGLAPIGAFPIRFTRDPALPWTSTTGLGGVTEAAVVDIAPYLRGGHAYVALPHDLTFVLSDDAATRLVDELFARVGRPLD